MGADGNRLHRHRSQPSCQLSPSQLITPATATTPPGMAGACPSVHLLHGPPLHGIWGSSAPSPAPSSVSTQCHPPHGDHPIPCLPSPLGNNGDGGEHGIIPHPVLWGQGRVQVGTPALKGANSSPESIWVTEEPTQHLPSRRRKQQEHSWERRRRRRKRMVHGDNHKRIP